MGILNNVCVWYVGIRGKVRGTEMKLTERELDVLACILVGEKSLRSTARLLHISHSAVGTYFQRALEKTKCETKDGLKNQGKRPFKSETQHEGKSKR